MARFGVRQHCGRENSARLGNADAAAAGQRGEADAGPGYDTGTGHAPAGTVRSKNYEELFPVETARFGYEAPPPPPKAAGKRLRTAPPSREAALDERIRKKADRYCK
eukprot:SM000007S20882  [mRNA]  locus=s7:692036:692666:+ [translate_table: standard]